MKNMLIALLLASNLLAYQEGDTIENEVASKLKIKEQKIYIVDFFASWCGSCKKEIPLISVANTKIDKSAIEIIGVDVDKNVNDALKFQKMLKSKNTLNFRVINDPKGSIISKFSPIGMPTLYYIKNKKIVQIVIGAVDAIDQKILKDLEAIQ